MNSYATSSCLTERICRLQLIQTWEIMCQCANWLRYHAEKSWNIIQI